MPFILSALVITQQRAKQTSSQEGRQAGRHPGPGVRGDKGCVELSLTASVCDPEAGIGVQRARAAEAAGTARVASAPPLTSLHLVSRKLREMRVMTCASQAWIRIK